MNLNTAIKELEKEKVLRTSLFKLTHEIKNPLFTENGKRLLICLQEHPEKEAWKAREVADELGISSRSVSGGMRKLVNDGFVEKLNDNPVVYAITNKGKEITIEE